jgi:hypothetical protein
MWKIWGEKIGSPDIAKWPHHGQARDNADLVMHAMDPAYILTTTNCESASVRYAEAFPDHKTRFFNCADRDVIIDVAADGALDVSGGFEGVNPGEYYVMTTGKIK